MAGEKKAPWLSLVSELVRRPIAFAANRLLADFGPEAAELLYGVGMISAGAGPRLRLESEALLVPCTESSCWPLDPELSAGER